MVGAGMIGALALASAVAMGQSALEVRNPEIWITPDWTVIDEAQGDLNRDGLDDVAYILWPTAELRKPERHQSKVPYRLLVGLDLGNGTYRKILDNRRMLAPPDASGMGEEALGPDAMKMDRGSIVLTRFSLGGHTVHRFRIEQGRLMLIGYDQAGAIGNCFAMTSMNFLTRRAKIVTAGVDDRTKGGRFERRLKAGPVSIEEVSEAEYHPFQHIAGPLTFCSFKALVK